MAKVAKKREPKPGKGAATLELGGKTRSLRYDFNALAEIEDATGSNVFSDPDNLFGNLSAKRMRLLLWAGLLHAEPELTEREVGSWLDLREMGTEMMEGIAAAVEAALPDASPNGSEQGTEKK